MVEYVLPFGTEEQADKVVVCWRSKKEGAEGWGMTFYQSTKPFPFDTKSADAEKYIDEEKPAFTMFFGEKNGKRSIRNVAENLQKMLRAWEEEDRNE